LGKFKTGLFVSEVSFLSFFGIGFLRSIIFAMNFGGG